MAYLEGRRLKEKDSIGFCVTINSRGTRDLELKCWEP